ncbi:cupin domain-containing protein [Phytohabitans aurantiacus]|uniref:Cupin type-2 domain-containing protein n=1 Tax=Phytohabitans aurantiacus TaxID=3016789 RepID=A0ABQ5QXV9_9ACTN|nr:cupin domain-containing protein [Phytohabitans aurantiacus]GLH98175.1 hypothetical protein Pa4123_34500 [Phytohabitans aurantiacus]
MIVSGQAHTVLPDDGRVVTMGVIQMRVLAAGEPTTGGAFSLVEFTGQQGPWTVPHLHRRMEESFFVLDGDFTFEVGDEKLDTGPGSYVLIPRGVRHMIRARGSGTLLGLMVPGGLEEMFFELGRLPADSITDPAVRAAISARYDSVPV